MKRLLIRYGIALAVSCALILFLDLLLKIIHRQEISSDKFSSTSSEERAVIPPPETFALPPGKVITLTALDFSERSRFTLNRFRREPLEPLLTFTGKEYPVIGGEFAIARTNFPGPNGRYRVWIDSFLRKGSTGRLVIMVDDEPVGTVPLQGNENRWARITLPDEINISHEAIVSIRAEKVNDTAMIGRMIFERTGELIPQQRLIKLLRGPMVQSVTQTSAYLIWETNIECKARLEFGPTIDYGHTGLAERSTKRHVMRLYGLSPDTEYFYRISCDSVLLLDGLSFRTNKPPGAPFRFVVFGDSGSGVPAQYRIAQQVEKVVPDFMIHTGDLIYGAGEPMNYPLAFFTPYGSLIRRIGFYPCLGNHDYGTLAGQPFLETFRLPDNGPPPLSHGRNYWFEYGDALFVAVDSNTAEWQLNHTVGPWLEKILATSSRTWKFVYFHHPPYSAGCRPYSDPDASKLRRTLVPILERRPPTLVFCGHDHFYARLRPIGGVRYIVTGGGGAGLYSKQFNYGFDEVLYNERHSFTQVDIKNDQLTLTQINDLGKTIDQFRMISGPSPAVQPLGIVTGKN